MHVRRRDQLAVRPSALARTLGCPGWSKYCESIPKEENDFAVEGSVVHALAEHMLRHGVTSSTQVELKGRYAAYHVTDEMRSCAEYYAEYCRALRTKGVATRVESRLDGRWFFPGFRGTVDFTAIEPLRSIEVVDLKAMFNYVDVGKDVGDNPQLSAYGLLECGKTAHVEDVTLTIVQPRCFDGGDMIRSVHFKASRLYAWAHDVLKPGLEYAVSNDPERIPGSHCKYCPGIVSCPEYTARMQRLYHTHRENYAELDIYTLIELYESLDCVVSWASKVKDTLRDRVLLEGPNDKYKCVKAFGNRKFRDPAAAASELAEYIPEEEIYTKKIKTPAKLEAALKHLKPAERKEIIGPLVIRPEAKPKLVKAGAKGDALPPLKEQLFERGN